MQPLYNYRPQTKFAKVMFLHLSVSDSIPRGLSASVHARIHPTTEQTPPEQTPLPTQCMLGDTGNKRAVRILLRCILVM